MTDIRCFNSQSQAALLFTKVFIKANAISYTANNAYKLALSAAFKFSYNNTFGVAIDSTAVYLAITRMFSFFVLCGEFDARIYTITNKLLYKDAATLNYFELQKFASVTALAATIAPKRLVNTKKLRAELALAEADAIFLLDSRITTKTIAELSTGNFFVFGLVSNNQNAFFFDTYLPVDSERLEVQYFFIELAFFGLVLGKRAYFKKLLVEYKNIATHFMQI